MAELCGCSLPFAFPFQLKSARITGNIFSFSNASANHSLVASRIRSRKVSLHNFQFLVQSKLVDDSILSNPEGPDGDSGSGATLDIKLPRRSLLVKFTCGKCGGTTQRLINRVAYERGLVYVQCAECKRYHKLVDHLGLVHEFDLREEEDPNCDSDSV